MSLRYEAWTLPWSGSFDRVIADVPVVIGSGSGTKRLSDFGSGTMDVPAGYSRLDEIVSNTVGSLMRVFDGPTLIDEFFAERVNFALTEAGGVATVSGDGVASGLDRAIIYPYDYEGSPSTFPNHVWGGPNVLSNPGFELAQSQNEIYEVWVGPEAYDVDVGAASGGTFTLTVDGQTTATIAYDAAASTVATRLNDLSNVEDVDVTGTGSTSDPWQIEFHDPQLIAAGLMTGNGAALTPSDTLTVTNTLDPALTFTLTMEGDTTASINWDASTTNVNDAIEATSGVTDVLVSGGGSPKDPWRIEFIVPFVIEPDMTGTGVGLSVLKVQVGKDDVNGEPIAWTKSQRADARSDPAFHGTYRIFRLSSGAEPVRTGSHSLVVAGTQYAGIQQIVNVEPGGTYQASCWIRTNASSQSFRLVMRDRFEKWIAQVEITPTADTWTEASITDVVIPADVEEVVFRFANINANPAGIWYFDDASFTEGLAASNVGVITQALKADADTDHAADTRGILLDWVDDSGYGSVNDSSAVAWANVESFTAFRGATYGQTFDRLRNINYEWELVAKPSPGAMTHDLKWYQVGNLGTDYSAAATPSITVGMGVSAATLVKRIPQYTAVLVEGAEGVYVEDKDATAETNFGRLEKYRGDVGLTSITSLNAAAQHLIDLEVGIRTSIQVTVSATPVHPRPLVDYLVGDTLQVQFPPVLAKTAKRVSQITYQNTEPPTYQVQLVEPPA